MTDILSEASRITERKIRKIVKERMKWPNPNYSEELEEVIDKYMSAYARHFFGMEPEISPTGLPESTWDQYKQAYDELCNAVMKEGRTYG